MRTVFYLIGLNLRAKVRKYRRQLGRPAYLILTLLLSFCLAIAFISVWRSGGMFWNPETVVAIAPIVLFAMLAGSFVNPQAQRQLFFSSAEVVFLFPGPFSRRHLLAFKWLQGCLAAALPALIFSIWMASMPGGIAGAFVALWLIFLYLAALGLALRFLLAIVPEKWLHRFVYPVAVVAALAGVWHASEIITAPALREALAHEGLGGVAGMIRSTWLGAVLLAPFEPFGRLLAAATPGEFFRAGGVCLSLYAGLVGFLFWSDVDFRESSLRSSARLEKHFENVKRGQAGAILPAKGRPRIGLPLFPSWRGAGAIGWRQMVLGLRSLRGAVIGFVIPLAVVAGMLHFTGGFGDFGQHFIWGLLFWLSLALSGNGLTCDFRADLPHMDTLKSLPVSPMAVAVGEVLPATFLLWFLQLSVLAVVAAFQLVDPALAGLVFLALFPFNLLLFIAENMAVLLFPIHPDKAGSGPVTLRAFMIFFVKGGLIGVVGGGGAGLGLLAAFLTGSTVAGLFAGAALVFIACGALLYAIGCAYDRFDPSRHAPSEEG